MTMVTMSHPDIAGTADATQKAFEDTWEPLGWVLVDPDTLVSHLPAAMHWAGDWDSGRYYEPGDQVEVSGSLYVALQSSRNKAPASEPTYWEAVGGSGGGGSTPDADATTKGKVQLAGDLGGTAAAPTVPGKIPYPTAGAAAILSTAGPLIPSPSAESAAIREAIRLPRTASITSTNKTGDVVNLIGVTLFPDGTMPYTKGWVAIGDGNLEYIHLLSKLDCAGQPIIDTDFVGNSEGLYNPRLSQALDSTVGGYDALTVGISSMPAGGVGYTNAIDRLVFNSGQSTANSKATFKNLGSVEMLSDTMVLKFGATGDASLARSVATGAAGVRATGDLSASGLVDAAGNLQTGSGNLVATANVAFAMYANNITSLPVATFVNTSGTPTGNFDFATAGGATPTLVLAGAGTATNVNVSIAPKGTGAVNIASGGATQKVGFYGATAVAKQTGVAVTDAGIHAALVALGLIAA